MKKILLILILILFVGVKPCFAYDDNDTDFSDKSGQGDDMMKYTNSVENAFAGQKKITDEEFQKVLKQVKEKRKKKTKSDKPFKGSSFNEENNGTHIGETADKSVVLTVPLSLVNGDGAEIPVGHYKIVGEKVKDKVFLSFYQSAFLVAKVPAIETNSDFDQKEVNFVQILPYNEQRIKIIYGSLDFNAYTFIKIKNQISDLN